MLEIAPAVAAAIILVWTYSRFCMSNLAYWLILAFAIIIMIGGHWTYAQVPLFNYLRDTFGLSRNYYDRVGHIMQGFVPAILAREVLLRTSPLKPGKWLFFIVVCICLAISAMYEFFEWGAAVTLGQQSDQFLATQGDQWDTQWDMFLAFGGAIVSQLLLSRMHDRSMARLAAQ